MNGLEKAGKFVGGTFSIWVLLFACLGFFFPAAFTGLKGYIQLFLGIVMFGMNLSKRKAVTLETGMQNSGLGAALAAAHFNPVAAVPSAIFSVWHNISGSLLATWFSRREEKDSTARNN
ncbi:hypothetical protein [Paenibacillus terrae]|uniref:Uncharacterized protein n=1 Tax=Paenibacillus terrae TaxID=159743 RepID=A0A0D7X2H6_9BACL|nr:hypothetical protein [Paenibacillus terrae]KJD45178.1 hypothetical protein QD47_12980 [Paenibacillus terrae]